LEIKDASAAGAMTLAAQGSVATSGALAAGSVALATPGSWTHSGSLDTRGAITIEAGRVSINGALASGAELTIHSAQVTRSAASLNNDRAAPIVTLSHTQLYDAALLNSTVVGTRDCGGGQSFCTGLPVTIGQLAPNYANLTLGSTSVRLPRVDQTITSERE